MARIVVQANDSPFGVVLWEKGSEVVPEPNGLDATTHVVYVVRQQGTKGELQIAYQYACLAV